MDDLLADQLKAELTDFQDGHEVSDLEMLRVIVEAAGYWTSLLLEARKRLVRETMES